MSLLGILCIVASIVSALLTAAAAAAAAAATFAVAEGNVGYSVVLDAGSTGSRAYVYKFQRDNVIGTIKEITSMRTRPGLSTFYGNESGVVAQIADLLEYSKRYIDADQIPLTEVSLYATAGMRTIPEDHQEWILARVQSFLAESDFHLPSTDNVRILSGEDEALFAFLSIHVAIPSPSVHHSFAVADLGGSSHQISFVLPPQAAVATAVSSCMADYSYSMPGSIGNLSIAAKSFAGMGIISAMVHLLDEFVDEGLRRQTVRNKTMLDAVPTAAAAAAAVTVDNGSGSMSAVFNSDDGFASLDAELGTAWSSEIQAEALRLHPCMSVGTPFPHVHNGQDVDVFGSGDFEHCSQLIRDAFILPNAESVQCFRDHPPTTLVAIDNFPKSLEMLGLQSNLSMPLAPSAIAVAGAAVCRMSWTDLAARYPHYPLYKSQKACFAAAYMYTLLTELYGLQPDDNHTFVPMNEYEDYTLSWPLGAAVQPSLHM